MNLTKITVLGVAALLSFSGLKAQITVAPISAVNAVQNVLVGSGVTTSNINSFNTNANSIGVFDNGLQSNIGINRGIVLTSGLVNANPAFNAPATAFLSVTNGGGSDPNLNTIIAGTQDRAVLQFDFVPAGDTLKFKYVFASEEYPEFVGSSFNDVFAFFLTGPNPAGPAYNITNIALIPGTATPVSINNVSPVTNSQYYVANSSSNFVFDGYTVVLTAIAPVVPCSTYTIKLAIADVGDTGFDSAVFLEENSFGTGAVTISPTYNYTNAVNDTVIYEGCSDVTINFFRDGVIGQADTVDLNISGTAINGVDYTTLPSQIIFAPGQSSVSVTISALQDALTEGPETVTLSITNINACGEVITSSVTFTIQNVTPLTVNGGPDRLICPGVQQTFDAITNGGVPPLTVVWAFPGGGGTDPLTFTPTQSGTYVVTATDGCGIYPNAVDTVQVTIGPPQFSVTADVDSASCFGVNNGAINLIVVGQTPPFSYAWTPGNITSEDLTGLSPGTYSVTVTDQFGCQVTESFQVFEPANIPFNITDKFVCSGANVNLNPNPLAGVNYQWEPANFFDDPNAVNPSLTYLNPGPDNDTLFLNVTATSPGACGQDNFRIFVTPLPQVELFLAGYDTSAICPGDTIILSNSASNTNYPPVTGYLWQNGATTQTLTTTSPGTYWLELTNNAGCKFRDSLELVPVTFPTPFINPEFFLCGGETITLSASGYDSTVTFLWSNGAITETIDVNTPGTYTLIVGNACSSDTVSTTVIEIPTVEPSTLPNIFTPNGDNVNDVYTVPNLFEYSIKFNVKIYSRWGNKVFETEDKEINWAPKNISDGVYFMTILYVDCNNEEKKLAHTVTISGN